MDIHWLYMHIYWDFWWALQVCVTFHRNADTIYVYVISHEKQIRNSKENWGCPTQTNTKFLIYHATMFCQSRKAQCYNAFPVILGQGQDLEKADPELRHNFWTKNLRRCLQRVTQSFWQSAPTPPCPPTSQPHPTQCGCNRSLNMSFWATADHQGSFWVNMRSSIIMLGTI